MRQAIVRRARGFTLVELMVAMTLSLLLAAAIISVFLFNRRSFAQDEAVQRMQDDARHAIRQLATDLSMAGFWADLLVSDAVTPDDDSLAVAIDCGPSGVTEWIYDLDDSLSFVDNATGATASAAFGRIGAGQVVPGSDVFSIKRLAGTTTAAAAANRVYLRTNGTLGLLFREPASTPAVNMPAPFTEWEYRPSIYYVRNYGVFAGDGIPTLCRKVLQAANPPTMVDECLALGVENVQVEFGLDTDDDGNPNVFVGSPSAAELDTAVAARVHLLVRSAEPDPAYTNDKTYDVGNAPAYTPADNFYRRVYSVTVGMHNRRASLAFGS